MKKLIFLILYLIHKTTAEDEIYVLSDEDYSRMPSKYHLDLFQKCLARPGGQYCTVWADLVADQPSELLDMINAYSAHYTKHFNYSNIRYGLCLTRSCRQFYDGNNSHAALWSASEACLNHSLSSEYDLKARVTDIDCYQHGHTFEKDWLDVAVGLVVATVLALNIAGSVYDIWLRDPAKPGNKFLTTFSIVGNWWAMVEPSSNDPKQIRLRGLNGIRALTSILVILGHVPFTTVNAAINPNAFEETYRILANHILHQGHLITQTFFSMSGFLLAYNLENQAEKEPEKPLSVTRLPRTLFNRWLRLSPPNIMILLLTTVWYKYITVGPLFREQVTWEASDCHKYWLYNVFYVTNLIDHTQCNLQVWFLASDLQLHIIASVAVLLTTTKRARNMVLGALFVFGIVYPAYLVYSLDLDGTYLPTPTTLNHFCVTSSSFNLLFKTAAPNMSGFVMGMFFGYFVYDMHKRNLLNVKYRKYRVAFWLSVVSLSLVLMIGAVLYRDAPRPPLWLRVMFQPVVKPLFNLCINLIILGLVCRCDDLVRGILEWDGWMPITKISYCMYLTHMMILRYTAGTKDSLFYSSSHHTMQLYFGMTAMTIIFATLLHLLVEAPFGTLAKRYTSSKPAKKKLMEQTEEPTKPVEKTE